MDGKADRIHVASPRFGTIDVPTSDVLRFPLGLIGFEDQRAWVLLADAHNDALGWLQSLTEPRLALAVVSPRRFVPGFRLRVTRSDLAPLALERIDEAHVLAILAPAQGAISLNLKAPLVLNLARRLGQQVIGHGDLPVQFPLVTRTEPATEQLRRVA